MKRKKNYRPYKQGLYTPINNKKYIGKGTPRYLSSWELRFFRWCDTNPNIIEWGSENIIIPYQSPVDKKIHRYMVDNYVMIKEGSTVTKYLIEIKPKKQTVAPTKHGNKKRSTILYEHMTWAVNCAKWDAASQWCSKNDIKFQILTEDHLFFNGK
jgi:hypothetical protein